MEISFKKLSEKAKTPAYATEGSAGLDLAACIDDDVTIKAGGSALINTGIAISINNAGYAGMVYARSGLAIKNGICLSNGVGVIDSDYTGEIKIGLTNLSNTDFTIKNGDRIAQLVIMPVCQVSLVEKHELTKTKRADNGFGSTGVR